MNTNTTSAMHLGRKIERIRILRGVKQEALASALGITQQAVSKMENSAEIEEERLEKVASVLDVSVEAIKNFDEEKAVNIVSNTFNDSSVLNGLLYFPTFNPIDKIVELYERMLKLEQEKNELLQKLIK
jgi:transcriptional regulator with XRE-family HTH domain